MSVMENRRLLFHVYHIQLRVLYPHTEGKARDFMRKGSSMIHEFSRTELLIGEDGLKRLERTWILIFGIGGVGGHCAEALARSGIGHMILVDPDHISLTNINRQAIAYHSTLGCLKTQVMKERILDINPQAKVETRETFVLPENLEELFSGLPVKPDYIIDAIDTVSAKLAIAQYAYHNRIPLISSMGTGNKLHPELFETADIRETSVCPLCKVMRRELKRKGIPSLKVLYSREIPKKPAETKEETGRRATPASIAFVPPAAGLMIAGEAIRDILGIS